MTDPELKKMSAFLQGLADQKREQERRKDREAIIDALMKMPTILAPLFEKIAEDSQVSTESITKALKGITIENHVEMSAPDIKYANLEMPAPQVTVPEIKIPEIKIPEIKIPTIYVPRPQVDVHVPPVNFPSIMKVLLQDVDMKHPLPVLLMGLDGKPFQFSQQSSGGSGGMGGGRGDFYTIRDILNSTGGSIIDADGNVKVAGSFSVTASNSSTQAIDSSGNPYNQANPMPVTVVSGGGATTGSALVDSSGSQYSGSNPLPVQILSGGGATSAVNLSDSSGVGYSGSNPLPVTNPNSIEQKQVSGFVDSVSIVSQLVALETRQVSGAIDSMFVTGFADSMTVYQARRTNLTPLSDGADVRPTTDDLGRTLTRPVQVRDLTLTAYATLANGTETTLRAAVSGAYLDLIYIMGANNSDAAVTVDLRASTGGSIVMTLQIPANGTAGIACPVPLPGADLGASWTADMTDITGTSVFLTALFSQEV